MLTPPYIPNINLIKILPKISIKGELELNESQPITFFYHALISYAHSISQLKKKPTSFNRTAKYNNMQQILLSSLHLIYSEMYDSKKSPRPYLRIMGSYTRRELQRTFSQTTFQYCIGITFRLLTEEVYYELEDAAKTLYSIFEATRVSLVRRCLKNTLYPYDDLFPILEEFDRHWADFESRLIEIAIVQQKPHIFDEDKGMIQFITNEMLAKSLIDLSIERELVDDRDPSLFVALPRMTVLGSLYGYNGLFDITDPLLKFSWYRSYSPILQDVKIKLDKLGELKVMIVKRCLIDGEGANKDNCQEVEWCYHQIAQIADSVVVQKASEWNLILRCALQSYY